MNTQDFLFEISWEVCNKVGGIHTVLYSKLKQVVKNFGSNYILLGPWLDQKQDFVEATNPFYLDIKQKLATKNLQCHIGYWDSEEKPTVILVEFKQRYPIDSLLYNLWADFGVDSLNSNYEYHEPVLFATAAGEVICTLAEEMLGQERQVIAHFHEWMSGAGLLYVKKSSANIATVFTTHATVLGRAISPDNLTIYHLPPGFDPEAAARQRGIFAKHSLEKATAREADCFTAVSNVTADEAHIVLGKYPDKIIFNGLDITEQRKRVVFDKKQEYRTKLLQVASEVVGQEIAPHALLWVTSGRYEFHNKGYDLLLRSLAQLEHRLTEDAPPIIMFILIAVNWYGKQDSLAKIDLTAFPEQLQALGIATHKIYNPAGDSILKLSNELNLKQTQGKVHVVFSDAYLQGNDGVFDISYEQILESCDLSIFPSFYEPWGYTPLESLAYSTPTITTDLSGFGYWIVSLPQDYSDAIYVLKRKDCAEQQTIAALCEHLWAVSKNPDIVHNRVQALQIASLADWRFFYKGYLDAYMQAIKFNKLTHTKFDTAGLDNLFVSDIDATTKPRWHAFQYARQLPEKLSALRTLAYNFWWTWHEESQILWRKIDPDLWEKVEYNPIKFLNLVPSHALTAAVKNPDYMELYSKIIREFTSYMQQPKEDAISPIAYFCMEYGITECLPIYSGGLGILAGDYLKAMSDLGIPTVAVGLFYKQGYFKQKINARGEQETTYETWEPNQMPLCKVNDAAGNEIVTSIEVLGQTIYMQVWQAQVGHVNLYLLDTDVPENSPAARKITDSLYGGSREVRLVQEMILGVGGVRFLLDKLKIQPALYHLNEGHSAFLLLERIGDLCQQGYCFEEAQELVRSSSMFTTHTPVAAGNEAFAEELVRKYLQDYAVSYLGITFDRLFNLARDGKMFSMTVLALRLTLKANAVSQLHGKVARAMWNTIWPGALECEVPIGVVTNGVHLATWLGQEMKSLYTSCLSKAWLNKQDETAIWGIFKTVGNEELWRVHQAQKSRLINEVKRLLVEQYTWRSESKHLLDKSLDCLSKDVLLIGLARRFTLYKRNDLFLLDAECLARILTNTTRPVVILIAGKAHPADTEGKNLIREIMTTLRQDIFQGRIIFLEEYNIDLAKLLVQGVDVWLNTPILGREACGTSGMKAGINGALNFSTRDGWWDEAYSEQIGWQIASLTAVSDLAKRDDMENRYLLDQLEAEIVPLYYNTNSSGYSSAWIEKMKASIACIACNYNNLKMAKEYYTKFYGPILARYKQLKQNNMTDLQKLVIWKQNIVERFHTASIKAIFINGIKDGKITSNGWLKIKLLLFAGKMIFSELAAEFVLLKNSDSAESIIIPLQRIASHETGVLTYIADYHIEDAGFYSYSIRVLPYNSMLFHKQDTELVCWG